MSTQTRIVSSEGYRRRAVATALGGALTLVGLRSPEQAEARRKCPRCKKRNEGKGKPKPNRSGLHPWEPTERNDARTIRSIESGSICAC